MGKFSDRINCVWYVLHGYGHQASVFLEKFRALADDRTLFIAPEALSRFYLKDYNERVGASWMTREDRLNEISDYIHYLDAVYEYVQEKISRPVSINVLGFSQGASTASRWTMLGKARADNLILWGGKIPPDLDLIGAKDKIVEMAMQLYFITGRQDKLITEEIIERDIQKLEEAGLSSNRYFYDGGHKVEIAVLKEFLHKFHRDEKKIK